MGSVADEFKTCPYITFSIFRLWCWAYFSHRAVFPLWKRPSSYTTMRSKCHVSEHFWTNSCLCWLKIDMESSFLYLGAAVITNLLQHDKRYQCTALKLSLFAAGDRSGREFVDGPGWTWTGEPLFCLISTYAINRVSLFLSAIPVFLSSCLVPVAVAWGADSATPSWCICFVHVRV